MTNLMLLLHLNVYKLLITRVKCMIISTVKLEDMNCTFKLIFCVAIGILPCCHAIAIINTWISVLISYSTLSLYYLFAMASDERSNMFVAADEKNSTKRVALLTEQYRDEMSI